MLLSEALIRELGLRRDPFAIAELGDSIRSRGLADRPDRRPPTGISLTQVCDRRPRVERCELSGLLQPLLRSPSGLRLTSRFALIVRAEHGTENLNHTTNQLVKNQAAMMATRLA